MGSISTASVSGVLEARPPRFSPAEVAVIAADAFGLTGHAVDLGSERDQTFLVGGAVVKISNLAEDPAVLEFEAHAIEHALHVHPELPMARLAGTAALDGHIVRRFGLLGGGRARGPDLDD